LDKQLNWRKTAKLGLKPLKENRRHALYGILERRFGRYLVRLLGLGRSV
jgi:hypothetical protein